LIVLTKDSDESADDPGDEKQGQRDPQPAWMC
jgi:hypothetical protein